MANSPTLRDRIAAAIWERQNPGRRYADCEYRWQADAEADADAVLAVLPPPADRAAVLREEADRIDATRAQFPIAVQNGITWATAELRRHAAETATTETEAPDIAWHILTHQRGTWRPWLAPRDDHAEAREDYDRCVADNGHRWAFRLVRETSTFTVEAEHQPAAGARQDATATNEPAPGSTDPHPCRTFVSGGTVWCCEEGETDCPCVCHQPAVGARQDKAQPSTPPCTHCTHPKGDHDGRADHRAKHLPIVAGEPWCHACNAPCDYIAGAQQDEARL